jgi:predicted ABC-type ATPase
MPNLYIIAGCNGAGKTTASFNVLPKALDCEEFVNADEIARGISPFHPEKVAIEAGKIMLRRIDKLIAAKLDFAIETTLTTTTYRQTIREAQSNGYEVTLLFFWLNSEELAIDRVKQRVSEGGHNIPEETIRRRPPRNTEFIRHFLDICDNYMMVDNSNTAYVYIAEKMEGIEVIHSEELFRQLKSTGDEKDR